MFPRDFYEILHVLGIALIFSAIGAVAIDAAGGGSRKSAKSRGLVMGIHGVGALLILVGGFGMLARMGFMHGTAFPGWIIAKIVIWLLLSIAIVLPYRVPSLSRPMFVLLPFLAGAAVYLALYKPI